MSAVRSPVLNVGRNVNRNEPDGRRRGAQAVTHNRWNDVRLVFILLLCLLAHPSQALDNGRPELLLRDIYDRYRSVGTGLDITGPEAQRVVDPALLALIRKDRDVALGEIGILNYDPICACQ